VTARGNPAHRGVDVGVVGRRGTAQTDGEAQSGDVCCPTEAVVAALTGAPR
jgi:hypothetical protein